MYDFLKLSNSKGSVSRISGSRVSKGQESSIDDHQPLEQNPNANENKVLLNQSPVRQAGSKIFEQYKGSTAKADPNGASSAEVQHPSHG